MVLTTRPRQEDIKHYLPDSADVSIVRGERSLRLRTISGTREEAERIFLLFTFTYGIGAGHALRVGQAPGAVVWEAAVTAVGRDARVCMSCDRYVPIFDCCVDANHVCMECMLAGRGPLSPPVPFATPRPYSHQAQRAMPVHEAGVVEEEQKEEELERPARRRYGRRRHHSGPARNPDKISAAAT